MDHRHKLARASRHVDDLKRLVLDHAPEARFQLRAECEANSRECSVRLTFVPPPIEWSLAAGDALHNMRSALDCLAFALSVKHSGSMTEAEERRVFFPICNTAGEFERLLADGRGVHRASDRAKAHVESVQPYRATPWNFGNPLPYLRDLNNIDKHRHLVATHVRVASAQFSLGTARGAALGVPLSIASGIYRNGAVVAQVAIPAGVDTREVRVLTSSMGIGYVVEGMEDHRFPGTQGLMDVLLAYLPSAIFERLEPLL